MKVTIIKTQTEEVELPEYFTNKRGEHYKVLDKKYVLAVTPKTCIARWLFDERIISGFIESTEEQFSKAFNETMYFLLEKLKEN